MEQSPYSAQSLGKAAFGTSSHRSTYDIHHRRLLGILSWRAGLRKTLKFNIDSGRLFLPETCSKMILPNFQNKFAAAADGSSDNVVQPWCQGAHCPSRPLWLLGLAMSYITDRCRLMPFVTHHPNQARNQNFSISLSPQAYLPPCRRFFRPCPFSCLCPCHRL